MCPGYFGATFAQRKLLAGQGKRAAWILPIGAIGGALGAVLLLRTGEAAFDLVVPFLLLFAAALITLQEPLRRWLVRGLDHKRRALVWAALACGAAAVYGGYFGAGLGVIVLAALGVVLDDDLVRLNALKQAVSLAVNVAAALVFAFSGRIDLPDAIAMAVGSLAGGLIGGAIASRVPAAALRVVVVAVSLAVAAYYFAKL